METKRRRLLWWFLSSLLVLVCLGLILAAYRFGWPETGFAGKTVWDWLQLLIIPLVLALVALLFNQANTRSERQIAQQRYEQDKVIAEKRHEQDQAIILDKQREDLLQVYLDRMSDLLIHGGLRNSHPDDDVRHVAQARTMSILVRLDARRIGYVFSFLREAGLLKSPQGIVNLSQANLPNVDWTGTDLSKIDLSGANLRGAMLRRANLRGAKLCNTLLWGADLWGADLSDADLRGAIFWEADLKGANLSRANLSEVNFGRYQLDLTDRGQVLFYVSNPVRYVKGGNLDSEATAAALSGPAPGGRTPNDTIFGRACLLGGAVDRINITIDESGTPCLDGPALMGAIFIGANLSKANLSGRDLIATDLSGVNLSGANLSQTKLEYVRSLKDTNLGGVTGLDKKQITLCKAKGAIIDKALVTDSSPPIVILSQSAQSNNAQTTSIPPVQGNAQPDCR